MKLEDRIRPFYLNKTLFLEGQEKIHLGSSSPRRIKMISQYYPIFRKSSPDIDEKSFIKNCHPPKNFIDPIEKNSYLTALLAYEKAQNISIEKNEVILTADTSVLTQNSILGKPADKKEALEMLYSLSNKIHYVTTGVCIYKSSTNYNLFHTTSAVKFHSLEGSLQKIVTQYVEGNKALDKAGAYGIQEEAELFVEWIYGDYNTIVGLPMAEVFQNLGELL